MQIDNGFLGKKSSFMKQGASIGDGNWRKLKNIAKGRSFLFKLSEKNVTITDEIDQIRSFVLHSYG